MKDMIADGLTKPLLRQRHDEFMKMISLEDISARIQIKKRMEALRDKIKNSKARKTASKIALLACKGVKAG